MKLLLLNFATEQCGTGTVTSPLLPKSSMQLEDPASELDPAGQDVHVEELEAATTAE